MEGRLCPDQRNYFHVSPRNIFDTQIQLCTFKNTFVLKPLHGNRSSAESFKLFQNIADVQTNLLAKQFAPICGLDSLNDSDSSLRKRRTRTNFSGWQLDQLETTFKMNHYPDLVVCEQLSIKLGLSGSTIQVWFQNRRAKWRRQENTKQKPGRPPNNAPRTSCSGQPLTQNEIVQKHLNRSSKKRKTLHKLTQPKISCQIVDEPSFKNMIHFLPMDGELSNTSLCHNPLIKTENLQTNDKSSNEDLSVMEDSSFSPCSQATYSTFNTPDKVLHQHQPATTNFDTRGHASDDGHSSRELPQRNNKSRKAFLPFNIENLLSS